MVRARAEAPPYVQASRPPQANRFFPAQFGKEAALLSVNMMLSCVHFLEVGAQLPHATVARNAKVQSPSLPCLRRAFGRQALRSYPSESSHAATISRIVPVLVIVLVLNPAPRPEENEND